MGCVAQITPEDQKTEEEFRKSCLPLKNYADIKALAEKNKLLPGKNPYWKCMENVITTCTVTFAVKDFPTN